jgi:hypothetical protein
MGYMHCTGLTISHIILYTCYRYIGIYARIALHVCGVPAHGRDATVVAREKRERKLCTGHKSAADRSYARRVDDSPPRAGKSM